MPAPAELGKRLFPPLLASVLLGTAPFGSEPHIVGKLRWVAGGAVGMAPIDWFDLVMHGAPFVWLAVTLVQVGLALVRGQSDDGGAASASGAGPTDQAGGGS